MPEPTDPAGLIVGIDIGGTKTHLLAHGPGGYLRERILPSKKWRSQSWQDDAARLLALSAELVEGARIEALGIGAHGCDNTEECAAFQAAFEAQTPVPVTVVNDAELMPLALGLFGQIGVVAGTGSIAVHRNAQGMLNVAGGWGWIIGDEGSAAGLMREAVRAVALHLDCGGDQNDPLVQAIFRALEVPSAARLGSALGNLRTAAEVGWNAPVIFNAADQGSVLAKDVISAGGQALADLVVRLLRNGVAATDIVAGGGVITSQPRLWQAFTEALPTGAAASLTLHLFTGKPVEGAINLAQSMHQSASHSGADTVKQ